MTLQLNRVYLKQILNLTQNFETIALRKFDY